MKRNLQISYREMKEMGLSERFAFLYDYLRLSKIYRKLVREYVRQYGKSKISWSIVVRYYSYLKMMEIFLLTSSYQGNWELKEACR